jgi:hypothetical protein
MASTRPRRAETVSAGGAVEAARRMAAAVDAGDAEALAPLLAPGVVLASPITGAFRYEGAEDVRTLMARVIASLSDYEFLGSFGDEGAAALHFRARVKGGQELEGLDLIRTDGDGLISEIRVFARPMPAVVALMGDLAPRLARERGRWRGIVVRLMTAPLALLTRSGDPLGARLLGRRAS